MHSSLVRAVLVASTWLFAATVTAQTFSQVRNTGPRANRINIVYIAEGYTAAQQGLFDSDVALLTQALVDTQVLAPFAGYLNTFKIFVASNESGTDVPHQGVARDTYFQSSVSASGYPSALRYPYDELMRFVPEYDVAFLLINAPGGGIAPISVGGPAISFVCVTRTSLQATAHLHLHELGHALAGLMDEYWVEGTVATTFAQHLNVSSNSTREGVLWGRFIAPDTPVPTRSLDVADETTPGIFQGGGGFSAGRYRATFNSMMRSSGAPWGAVNTRAFHQAIHVLNLEQPTAPPEITRSPNSVAVELGRSVTLSADVSGTGPLTFQWVRDGRFVVGATNRELTLPRVARDDAGVYFLEVTNARSTTVSSPAYLTVNPPPEGFWESRDIGAVGLAGSVKDAGSAKIVRGSGEDIWDTRDEFHYHYRTWTGDGTLVARSRRVDRINSFSKWGLMIRESLAPESRHASVLLNLNYGTLFQARATTNGQTTTSPLGSPLGADRWLRLVRRGDVLTGYDSVDGVTWRVVGSVTLAGLPATVHFGLAVTSHDDALLTSASFEQVSVVADGAPPAPLPPATPTGVAVRALSPTSAEVTWSDQSGNETGFEVERAPDGFTFVRVGTVAANTTRWTDPGLSPNRGYDYRVRAFNTQGFSGYTERAGVQTPSDPNPPPPPASWQTQDVGGVAAFGSATEANGTVTVRGSGADIWGGSDEFFYRYQPWAGDGEFIARVASLTAPDSWTKAGIMVRESLVPTARNVFIFVSPHGTAFQHRATLGSATNSTARTEDGGAPRWLRIVRIGNEFRGYVSPDGATWTQAGSVMLALPETALVGLAVTSHADGSLATANFESVALTGPTSPPPPPPPGDVVAPTGLVVRATAENAIHLAWNDNAIDETGYEVERSANGTSFTVIATPGANATQQTDDSVTTAGTYWYRVRAVRGTARSGYAEAPAVQTPPWRVRDIGPVGASGTAQGTAAALTLTASGADIWEGTDEGRFFYRMSSGSARVEARLTSLTNTHPWAKAGVMIRESLEGGARNVFLAVTAANGMLLQSRLQPNQATAASAVAGGSALPRWLRLDRAGSVITASISADGVTWVEAGRVTLAFAGPVYFGVAATSHNDGVLTTATFEQVVFTETSNEVPAAPTGLAATIVGSGVSLTWADQSSNETGFEVERAVAGGGFTARATLAANTTNFSDSAVSAGVTYHYRVRAISSAAGNSVYSATASVTVPSTPPPPVGWSRSDVGAVAATGSVSGAGTAWTLSGSGADIWEGTDAFSYHYQTWSGDGSFVARVLRMDATHPWAKAGIMVRDGLAANARHITLAVTPGGLGAVYTRTTVGGSTSFNSGASYAPMWLKLTRVSDVFTAWQSADGVAWTQIGGAVTLALPSEVRVGLVVTSHADGVLCATEFDQVVFTGGTTPPPPPPPPDETWQHVDVGAVGLAGSEHVGTATITLRGAGADIWENQDAFRFLYRAIEGDVTVEARIDGLTPTHPWAKAGVMMRASLAPDAANVFAMVTASSGVGLQRRVTPGAATELAPGPWGAVAPYWVRLVRRGATIEGFVSADGLTWDRLGFETVSWTGPVYVGFAVTSHVAGTLTTAEFAEPFLGRP